MSENNQMMSVEGQLVGMPLAGPESFSQQQLEYLKRALGLDETVLWEGTIPFTAGANLNTVIQLSEPTTNFERIAIYGTGHINYITWCPIDVNDEFPVAYQAVPENNGSTTLIGACVTQLLNKTQIRYRSGYSRDSYSTAANGEYWSSYYGMPYKIVGIHRISGGNT